jgi:hypothetical protein
MPRKLTVPYSNEDLTIGEDRAKEAEERCLVGLEIEPNIEKAVAVAWVKGDHGRAHATKPPYPARMPTELSVPARDFS